MACAPSEDSDYYIYANCFYANFLLLPNFNKIRVNNFNSNYQGTKFKRLHCLLEDAMNIQLQIEHKAKSDKTDGQTDPSLHWAHMPFCLVCHEATDHRGSAVAQW